QNDGEFKMSFFRFWFFNFGILVPLVLTLIGLIGWQVCQSRKTRRFELSAAIAMGLGAFVLACWRIGRHAFSWRWAVVIVLALILLAWCAARIVKGGFGWKEKLPEEVAFIFAATAIFIFFFSIKTAPWIWDNLKIGIWAYFIVLPFLWRQLIAQWELPIRAAVGFALFASGFVSLVGGLDAGKDGFGVANRGEVDAVGVAVRKMPLEARFAAWPTYNHPLLLDGRKVVMGYPGHLWTQGFDEYGKTNELLTKLMQAPRTGAISPELFTRATFFGDAKKKRITHRARARGRKRQHSPLPELGERSTTWSKRDRRHPRLLSDVCSTRCRERVQHQLTRRDLFAAINFRTSTNGGRCGKTKKARFRVSR